MIRIRLDMPKGDRTAVCETKAGSVKNLLDHALSRHGYRLDRSTPARYGFGVIARRVNAGSLQRRLYRVERVWIGSADKEAANALARIDVSDLWEPLDVSGAGLDLRTATIHEEHWESAEAATGYAVSPIRVLNTEVGSPHGYAQSAFGPQFDTSLNATMQRRLGRSFHLRFIPDMSYVRLHQGNVQVRMSVRKLPDGRMVALDGVVLPFLLVGPSIDIRDAWYSGLGAATGEGFGWWGVSEWS